VTAKSGIREVDLEPSSPVDPRAALPIEQREGLTQTALGNGTLLTSYDDPPLPTLLAADSDPLDAPQPQKWRRDKPVPPKGAS
jgi:hypothetical protein